MNIGGGGAAMLFLNFNVLLFTYNFVFVTRLPFLPIVCLYCKMVLV